MIREATVDDILTLTHIVELFCFDIGFASDFSYKCTSQHLFHMINHGVLLVAEKDNEIAGVIGGSASCSPWNTGVLVFEEQVFYVLEEYRNSSIAHRLISRFTEEISDIPYSTLKLMHNSPDLSRFYSKLGYEELETTYMKRG